MRQFKGMIFDLDGTVLDSMDVWHQVDIEFLGKRGIALTQEYVQAISALHFDAAADYTIARYALPETREAVVEEWFAIAEHAYANDVMLKPGAKEYLAHLKDCGVRLSVATSSDRRLYEPALRHNGIFEYFDAFTETPEVPRGKKFPDIYLRAAEKIGLGAPDCAVFEDILCGIQSAKSAGFYTVGVYEPHSRFEWEDIQATADRCIIDFTQLTDDRTGAKVETE